MITDTALTAFHKHLVVMGRSEATARSYHSDIKVMLESVNMADLCRDFGSTSNEYVAERRDVGLAANSVTRLMSSIRAFHKFLRSVEGLDVSEPFVDFRPPRKPKAYSHPLPGGMDAVDEMVKCTFRPSHRMLVGLCGYAGLRVHEARAITPRDLIENEDGWWLSVLGKGGKYREVPVNDKLLAIFMEMPTTEPGDSYVNLQDRGARKAITRIGERANIARPVSSHDLRHTFATWAYNRTTDIRVVQELMGHSSSSTTEGYTAVEQRAMRGAVS